MLPCGMQPSAELKSRKTPISLLALCQRACRKSLSKLLRVKRVDKGFLISFLLRTGTHKSVFVPQWGMGFQTILSVVSGSVAVYSDDSMFLPPHLSPVYRGGEEYKYLEYCLPVVSDPLVHKCSRCLDRSVSLSPSSLYSSSFFSFWPRIPAPSKMIDHLEKCHNTVLFRSYHSNLPYNSPGIPSNSYLIQLAAHAKELTDSFAVSGCSGVNCNLIVSSCGSDDCPFSHPHGFNGHSRRGESGRCTLSLEICIPVPTLSKFVYFDSLRKYNGIRPRRNYGDVFVKESDILRNLRSRFSCKVWDYNFSKLGKKSVHYIPSRRSRRRARARLLRS